MIWVKLLKKIIIISYWFCSGVNVIVIIMIKKILCYFFYWNDLINLYYRVLKKEGNYFEKNKIIK